MNEQNRETKPKLIVGNPYTLGRLLQYKPEQRIQVRENPEDTLIMYFGKGEDMTIRAYKFRNRTMHAGSFEFLYFHLYGELERQGKLDV